MLARRYSRRVNDFQNSPFWRLLSSLLAAVTALAGIVGLPTIAEAKVNTSMVEGRDKAAKFFNPLSPIRINVMIPAERHGLCP